jgi:two-component system sensor histidine kinase KdpD
MHDEKRSVSSLQNLRQKLKTYAPMSLKGWLVYLLAMLIASLVCIMLQQVSTSDVHVPIIFVLVVLVVSLLTEGYFYGILAALTSVIAVNYAFTAPYMQIDFTPYGYPLTFMTMLAVGVVISTLMTRVQQQEKLRLENEREKLRANLLRGMSHDLRTPLTGISGSISAVLDNDEVLSREQQRELLEGAKEDADWLCRMVENLLSVTRITDGAVGKLHTQEEALEEVIGAAVLSFRKRHPDISVEVSVPDSVPVLESVSVLLSVPV